MTYFLDNHMYPKEAMLEAISKDYISIDDHYGFICISITCDECPIVGNEDAFCDYASRHTKRRKQVATITKTEYPEVFL